MSLFDNLGKKISDASRSAVEKTKDIAEITRLNSIIKENDTQLELLYAELGEEYYKLHCNDRVSEFADRIKTISALIKKNSDCRESILELKGLVLCPYCGAEFENGEAKCPECGKAVPRTANKIGDGAGERLICSVCGYQMRPESNFCIMCGTPVKKDTAAKPAVSAKPTAAAAPTVSAEPTPDTAQNAAATGERSSDILTAAKAEIGTLPKAAAAAPARQNGGIFSDVTFETVSQSEKTAGTGGSQPQSPTEADSELDETAARAAAEISRMTAEKYAAKKAQADRAFSKTAAAAARIPAAQSASAEAVELPDFDAIDDGLVVEEQTITDTPSPKASPVTHSAPTRPTAVGIRCTRCGAPLEAGAMFCTKCGAPRKTEKKASPVCPGCGAFVNAGMSFCPECGMKL